MNCTEYYKQAFPGTAIPRTLADDMTVEKLASCYRLIKEEWVASTSCQHLALLLHHSKVKAQRSIARCICFGAGSFSGLRTGDAFANDAAFGIPAYFGQVTTLYQIAIFKSVVDCIATIQGTRPEAFAQEPIYTELDSQLLMTSRGGITSNQLTSSIEAHSSTHQAAFCASRYRFESATQRSTLAIRWLI